MENCRATGSDTCVLIFASGVVRGQASCANQTLASKPFPSEIAEPIPAIRDEQGRLTR